MPPRTRVEDDSLLVYPGGNITYRMNFDAPTAARNWSNPLYPVYRFPKTIRSMTDVVGQPGSFNPVDHFQLSSSITGGLPGWRNALGEVGEAVHGRDVLLLPQRINAFDTVAEWGWLPVLSAKSLSDWSIEAFDKFHAQIPTSVSLANSIYELKDMKGMIPTIDRKSLSKTASNNFLAFEFGVLPFVSDVKAIVAMSDVVDKRIKLLIANNGKTTHLSFDRVVDYNDPYKITRSIANPYDTLFGNDNVEDAVRFVRQSAKVSVHIGGHLTQNLRDLSDAMAKMKGLIASGGFNHPARIIWNAIPYSFVVDWFFSIGKLLDSLQVQPFGGEYDVSDVGYSVKSEATYLVKVQYHSGQDTVLGNSLLGTVWVKSFTRKPGFPVFSPFLTDGTLSPTQLVLGLAMLDQKRR